MPKTIRTPNGKVFRVNADTQEGAIREIANAGLAQEAGFINDPLADGGTLIDGPLDAFRIGAGRTFDRAFNAITRNTEREAEQQRLFDLSRGERGAAGTFGELAPALATLPISGGLKTAAGVGAAIGGLSDVENPLVGAGTGAAFGGLGFKAGEYLNRIPGVARFGDELSEQMQAAVQRARTIGLRLRPSQRNPALARSEALLESNIGSRAVFESIDEAQQKTLNRLAAESIGENTDDLSLVVLDRARSNISDKFKTALNNNDVLIDGFKQTIQNAGDDILRTPGVSPDTSAVVENAIKQINQAPSVIPASRYHAWQSAWRKLSSNAWKKGDSQLGDFYSTLAESIDEAALGSVPARNMELMKEARSQWSNYKALTRLQNTVNKQTGNVNARTYAKEVRRRMAGNEDLAAITDIAALPRFQNSGTADRLLSNQLLPGGIGAGIGAAVSDDPVEGALLGGALGFAGARGAANAMVRGGALPERLIPNLLRAVAAERAAQQ